MTSADLSQPAQTDQEWFVCGGRLPDLPSASAPGITRPSPLLARRIQVLLVAGVLAVSSMGTSASIAAEPDQEQEGTAAPDGSLTPVGSDEPTAEETGRRRDRSADGTDERDIAREASRATTRLSRPSLPSTHTRSSSPTTPAGAASPQPQSPAEQSKRRRRRSPAAARPLRPERRGSAGAHRADRGRPLQAVPHLDLHRPAPSLARDRGRAARCRLDRPPKRRRSTPQRRRPRSLLRHVDSRWRPLPRRRPRRVALVDRQRTAGHEGVPGTHRRRGRSALGAQRRADRYRGP